MTDKILKEIFNVTFLLAIITGLLFFAGSVFHSSYIQELSLPHDLFNISFNETLITGFFVIFVGSIYTIASAVLVALCIFMCLHMIGQLSEIRTIREIYGFFLTSESKDNFLDQPEPLKKIIRLSLKIVIFLIFVLFLWIGLFTVNQFSSHQASESANKSYTAAKAGSGNVVIDVDNLRIRGVILKCSLTHCGVFDNNSNNILVFPVSSIKNIEILHKKHNENQSHSND